MQTEKKVNLKTIKESRVAFRVPKEIHSFLHTLAEKNHTTISELSRTIILSTALEIDKFGLNLKR